ncbi:Cys-tRNA(Pro) deacylase [Allonocardiopsis opalescens]|uniref:Cys-tRNA(Pro)/Cys-tRNA(Cys) deacylase n=1 Tax=Allonocardiopsis opalescens TaxID=1144618 RepID=A0A2T0Q3Y2_9ACTN|nr:Cys-tRNA(Pro) deacylase [Allonocardiopsis opalescens]PRX98508.1 Cys-tRNA(Pro)/Cys-tRNA(Cys) deacylase [Allonocardiopsis opalescens]
MSRRKSAGRSGGTPAAVAAERAGVAFTLHPYESGGGAEGASAGYGEEAAQALGLGRDRIFKTLVASVDGALTVAVVPVSGSLDLKALAGAVGGKRAEMADPAAAERATGYVVGGISPLGQRRALPCVVDASASAHPTVFVSAGRRGLQLEIAPDDLVRLAGARTAAIARPARDRSG